LERHEARGDSGPVKVVARPLNDEDIVQSQMPVDL
jgi:hypothetical protein